jgi:hypothetical protein
MLDLPREQTLLGTRYVGCCPSGFHFLSKVLKPRIATMQRPSIPFAGCLRPALRAELRSAISVCFLIICCAVMDAGCQMSDEPVLRHEFSLPRMDGTVLPA